MKIHKGSWSIACVCVVLGFMLAVQFRTTQDMKASLPYQRIEDVSERLVSAEKERDALKAEVQKLRSDKNSDTQAEELRMLAGAAAVEGEGVIVRLDDSKTVSKAGDNPNLYLIHDDDLLRVVNELRAAGAEAISINGQRLTGTSEIRCAGPTLSVNNVRSAAPFEIHAIGDKTTLENSLKMRGGVAETLKVWGIQLDVETSDNVYVPPYHGTVSHTYAHETAEREDEK